jgi:YfiH family protein
VIAVELPGAQVAFTTRNGGVSEGPYRSANLGILTDDEPAHVVRNRELAAAQLDLDPATIAMGWQVHGTDVLDWGAPPSAGHDGYAAPGAELPKVDGHTTAIAGLPLLVLVADCLPVALASADRVAMVHCGWRGLAGGIVEAALGRFTGPVCAAVGPGIGQCCYEVGPEVLAAFSDHPEAADGRMLSLRALADAQLRVGGVETVEHVDLCTSCNEELFFSHRRDGGVTGRQAGIAWRRA